MAGLPELPDGATAFLADLDRVRDAFKKIQAFLSKHPHLGKAAPPVWQKFKDARERAFRLLSGLTNQAAVFEPTRTPRPSSIEEDTRVAVATLEEIRGDVIRHPERFLRKPPERKPTRKQSKAAKKLSRRIFLGHGRNQAWRAVEAHLTKCGLAVTAYESESRTGRPVVEVLREMLDRCSIAVMLATAEDATDAGSKRARQNVIPEIGLFQGRYGFERVAILLEDGVEGFSNIGGLEYISFPPNRVNSAFHDLDRFLEREGLLRGPKARRH